MAVKLRSVITYVPPEDIAKTKLRKIVKQGLQEVGETYIQQKYLGRHFTAAGFKLYGYKNRTATYNRRKQRQKGHRHPYVWSGETRRRALQQNTLKATATRVKVQFPGSQAAGVLKRQGYNVKRDLTMVNKRELAEVAKAHEAITERELANLRATKRVRA
jgi:hypothetical protein